MLETEVHCAETADDIITLDKPPQLQAPSLTQLSAATAMLAAKIKPAKQAISELEELERQREKWEGTELAASHKRLYSILLRSYQFYLRMKSPAEDAEVRRALRDGLDGFCKARDYKFKVNTHDMNRVVRAVFGDVERRRVSAYSLALRAALHAGPLDDQDKPTPLPDQQLIKWLEEKGGVEKVRLRSPDKAVPAKLRASLAESVVRSTQLTTFTADANALQLDAADANKLVLLIATYRPDGEIEVNAVVKNDKVLNAALVACHPDTNTPAVDSADQA